MLKIDYKDVRSIHEQIEDGIKELIIKKIFNENEQLPSVRELSISLTVNPNTVQKAYKQLEAEGFIYSVKGKGNFVSSPKEARDRKRITELYENLRAAAEELKYLGETEDTLIKFIKEELK